MKSAERRNELTKPQRIEAATSAIGHLADIELSVQSCPLRPFLICRLSKQRIRQIERLGIVYFLKRHHQWRLFAPKAYSGSR
jgi:hypothetical protein